MDFRGEELPDFMQESIDRTGGTVSAHYGLKANEFDKLTKDILCDMIQLNDKTKVLDKWFPAEFLLPKNGGIIRCRALAYASAMARLERMNDY